MKVLSLSVGLLLLVCGLARAEGLGNSTACNGPQAAGSVAANDPGAFDAQEAKLKDREAQANLDYSNEQLLCGKEQNTATPKATACMMRAQYKFEDTKIQIEMDRNLNNANRLKAGIDVEAASVECAVTGQTPAVKAENLRHLQALIGFKKREIDINTSYENAKLACHEYQSPQPSGASGAVSTDAPGNDWGRGGDRQGCIKAADKKHISDLIDLQIDENKETFVHSKNERASEGQ